MRWQASFRGTVLASALALGMGPSGSAFAQDEAEEPASAEDAEGEAAAPDPGGQGAKVEQAIQQIEQLNYAAARDLLFEVIRSGKATAEQMAQAYFNLGIVEAALDHEVEATDSFYLGLMLKPSLLFPAGGSPKIRARLNEARSRVTEVGVLEARAKVRDGMLHVHVDNDPLDLVKRVEAQMTKGGGEVGTATLENSELRAEVDSDVQSIQVVFYDDAGNQLKVIDVDRSAADEPKTPLPAQAGSPSVWQKWGLWAGVAGALGLGGTYFLMESGNLDAEAKDADDPIQTARLEEDRDRVGLYGIVGLSMAGAAAITAGVLFFTGDDEGGTEEEAGITEASLVPNVAPGHVGARFRMKF